MNLLTLFYLCCFHGEHTAILLLCSCLPKLFQSSPATNLTTQLLKCGECFENAFNHLLYYVMWVRIGGLSSNMGNPLSWDIWYLMCSLVKVWQTGCIPCSSVKHLFLAVTKLISSGRMKSHVSAPVRGVLSSHDKAILKISEIQESHWLKGMPFNTAKCKIAHGVVCDSYSTP